MKCAFCDRQIPDAPDEERTSCGQCKGGCRKVHCPYCGYANPVVPGFLKRWTKDRDKK